MPNQCPICQEDFIYHDQDVCDGVVRSMSEPWSGQ